MINLIPPVAKRAMKREYWLRVGVVWMLLLVFVLLVGMALLVPSFVLVQSQLTAYQTQLATAAEAATEQKEQTKLVREANVLAQMVYEFGMVEPLNRYVTHIQQLHGPQIRVQQMQFTREDGRVKEIVVVGTAADRSSLTQFSTTLNSDPLFTDADIPLSNFAANENIGFSVTVTVVPPQ